MNDITYCAGCGNYGCKYNLLNAFEDDEIKAVWHIEADDKCIDYIEVEENV